MARLYSSLKFLKYTDRLDALRSGEVVAPVHVRIKPTNTCNHSCWYCAYRFDDLQLGEDMDERDQIPRDKMFEIVEDLIAMEVKAVTFSGGGEPLIYKPLPEVIDALAAGGIKVATLTNGSNLKGRMADAFAAHGSWVRVSMDGWDGPSYAKNRGCSEDSFDKLMENMEAFAARGSDCVLGVSFIIDKDNHTHVLDMCQRLKAIGVGHVKLSGAIVSNEGAETNAYHAPFRDTANAQIEQALALNDGTFQVLDHYHEIAERFDKPYHTCPFLQYLTVIGADQTVYTCQDKAYTVGGTLGSIKERRFKDFWFSADNKAAMRAVDPAVHCTHHCVAHAKNLALTEILDLDNDHADFV